jgi:hypothetical protein
MKEMYLKDLPDELHGLSDSFVRRVTVIIQKERHNNNIQILVVRDDQNVEYGYAMVTGV